MDNAFNPSTISNVDNEQQHNNPMYHICHACHDYRSVKKSDIKRHFEKQKTCTKKFMSYETSKHFTIEEAIKRTFNVRYIIPFDVSNLCSVDYLYIVTHYKDPLNIVEYTKVIANRNALGLNDLPKIPVPATTVVTSNKYGNNSHKKINDDWLPSDMSLRPSAPFQGAKKVDDWLPSDMSLRPSAPFQGAKKVDDWLPSWGVLMEFEDNQKVAASRQAIVSRHPSPKKVSWLIPDEDDEDDDEDVILMADHTFKNTTIFLGDRRSPEGSRDNFEASLLCKDAPKASTESGQQLSTTSTKIVDQPSTDVKSTKKFQCPSCLKVYNYKKDLINHAKNPTLCMNRQWFNKAQMKHDITNTHISDMIPDVSSKYIDAQSITKQVNNP